MTRWEDLFKIRIANPDPSFLKHEIVKTILVCKLLYKHRKKKNSIRIYTEFEVDEKKKCDIYFEDLKKKEVLVFEIQKNYTEKWLMLNTDFYNNLEIPFMKSVDWIPVDMNELSDNLNELNNQLDKYI